MSSFSLNISEIKKNIISSKRNLSNYEEIVNMYIKKVSDVDSVWRDDTCNSFIAQVSTDKIGINEHINSLENYFEIISNFCVDICNIINYNFNVNNLNRISYDLKYIDKIIIYLNNIYSLLNTNYNILNDLRITTPFKYKYVLEQYATNMLNCMNYIKKIRKDIRNARAQIESLIMRYKYKVNNFDVKYISDKIMEHRYKIYSPNLKKN